MTDLPKLPKMKSIYSSHIDQMGYDNMTGNLHVTFSNGKTGVYSGVPHDIATQVMNAPSVGGALHSMVKPKYKFTYLDDEGD